MIVTFSGPIGYGKSAILSALAENGYNVIRMNGSNGSLSGQIDLLYNHMEQMHSLKTAPGVYIFESSFLDVLVYTTLLYGMAIDDIELPVNLKKICIDSQRDMVDLNVRLASPLAEVDISKNDLPVADIWSAATAMYFTTLDSLKDRDFVVPVEDTLKNSLTSRSSLLQRLSEIVIAEIEARHEL